MTPELQRITIHEALGWQKVTQGSLHYAWKRGDEFHYVAFTPNYLNSLDAMHEAVMSLPQDKRDNYDLELAVVVFGPHMRNMVRYQRFETSNAIISS